MESGNNKNSRRKFLGSAAATVAAFSVLPGNKVNAATGIESENNFAVFNVLDFDIIGDGVTVNTSAFQNLIDKCSDAGGGTVFFPPGDYLTGTFQIKDNVNIYLSPGTTIYGSTNQDDYKYGCLVYAEDAKNISITGTGTINGNGPSFFEKYKAPDGEMKLRVRSWRPNRMFSFVRCQNLLLQSITIEKSPCWTIHPIDCKGVAILGITMLNGIYEEDGPNTDGINPDGCSKVRIADCYLECGDDCIVLKVTEKSETKICRDIVVTNCVLQTSQTALKIGTETHGEFRNITFSNCVVHDSGGGFGLLMRDGGLIDGMVVNNITVDCTHPKQLDGQGIYIWSHRRSDETPWGMIKNVLISNMTIKAGGGIFVTGAKERYIEGLTLENIKIQVTGGRTTDMHDNPPDPFTAFGHFVAPYDVFCRYVNNLTLRNIQLVWPETEEKRFGSALRCWSVNDVEIDGFKGRQSLHSASPAISLKGVNGGFIHNCIAPDQTGIVFHVENSERISVIGNEFSRARGLYKPDNTEISSIFETGNRLPG